jgi:hypothetical protein
MIPHFGEFALQLTDIQLEQRQNHHHLPIKSCGKTNDYLVKTGVSLMERHHGIHQKNPQWTPPPYEKRLSLQCFFPKVDWALSNQPIRKPLC